MSSRSVARQLIDSHLVGDGGDPGEEIALRIDQTLTQDATGTAVMLELEAMGVQRAQTEVSVQYVDHNLMQADHRNADDHAFLRTACARYGIWFSPPGHGVSHPLHQQHFGVPGKSLVGSDSHTPAAGALGMLAFGAGGIEVATAIAGSPLYVRMPKIWGIELSGELRPPTSAKDVILEMLRRHGVDGGAGWILEYFGPGLRSLSAMDRHVIANMGTELGATTTVFPSDEQVHDYLKAVGRDDAFRPLQAEPRARYDRHEHIDLTYLEPLIAMPPSPGNVRRVRDVAGEPIHQAYIGSSANPGFRDFAVVAEIVRGRRVPAHVSLDINPTSRQLLGDLSRSGHLATLLGAGARIHEPGCNGCIGMGQAPATETISLRTVPRNFPARSGTVEDKVCLVSPETAAASALTGYITDPRDLDIELPQWFAARPRHFSMAGFVPPVEPDEADGVEIRKGPSISSLPRFGGLPDDLDLEILLTVDDDVSTDEIMPAGARVLPLRSDIPKISRFAFSVIAPEYAAKAARHHERGTDHAIVAGRNYGQGSSREHAALGPRYLGLRCVLAESFARIHRDNLVNYGILPLVIDADTRGRLTHAESITIEDLSGQLESGPSVELGVDGGADGVTARHDLNPREIDVLQAGGLLGATQ